MYLYFVLNIFKNITCVIIFTKYECFCLALCVMALTLASASLASDFIVLYSEDEKQLEAEYGSNYVCYIIMFLNSKRLNFQKYCLDLLKCC